MKVSYVTHMGDDLFVANALRRSFNVQHDTWSEEPRTKRGRSDKELIQDCARDGHDLPFRHPQITLACDTAVPIARQLGKHQVGFSWSEVSRRYKTTAIEYEWLNGTWRADVSNRRQGSGDVLPPDAQAILHDIQERNVQSCTIDYLEALANGACPEQARFLLPQSMIVTWTWTGSLLGWIELYLKRHHPDAQAETREFASQVGAIIGPLFPVSWAAMTQGVVVEST